MVLYDLRTATITLDEYSVTIHERQTPEHPQTFKTLRKEQTKIKKMD